MPGPRAIHRSALWALLCFVAALLVAGGTPLLRPQAMELVCSGAGQLKLVGKTDQGNTAATVLAMDCPLCLGSAPPPVARPVPAQPGSGQQLARLTPPAAPPALLARAPLPPRGPPAA